MLFFFYCRPPFIGSAQNSFYANCIKIERNYDVDHGWSLAGSEITPEANGLGGEHLYPFALVLAPERPLPEFLPLHKLTHRIVATDALQEFYDAKMVRRPPWRSSIFVSANKNTLRVNLHRVDWLKISSCSPNDHDITLSYA